MNHSTPTPELQAPKPKRVESLDIDIAMFGLHDNDRQTVLDFIRELKGKAPIIFTPEQIIYRTQFNLLYELKSIYAQIDVSRLAIQGLGQSETDSAATVLLGVINRLCELIEEQELMAKTLEQMAYPENGGDQ